jgi:hypothetical protein
MKPGATLGLSHGFLLGVMKNDGVDFRKDINVVLVAPKVRRIRLQQWGNPAAVAAVNCGMDSQVHSEWTVKCTQQMGWAAGMKPYLLVSIVQQVRCHAIITQHAMRIATLCLRQLCLTLHLLL